MTKCAFPNQPIVPATIEPSAKNNNILARMSFIFIRPPSRTILNLIVAFPCAGDGHRAMALEYRRVLQEVHKMRDRRGR
jgi:hypothetical protein